jgi:hypothetical protein
MNTNTPRRDWKPCPKCYHPEHFQRDCRYCANISNCDAGEPWPFTD